MRRCMYVRGDKSHESLTACNKPDSVDAGEEKAATTVSERGIERGASGNKAADPSNRLTVSVGCAPVESQY